MGEPSGSSDGTGMVRRAGVRCRHRTLDSSGADPESGHAPSRRSTQFRCRWHPVPTSGVRQLGGAPGQVRRARPYPGWLLDRSRVPPESTRFLARVRLFEIADYRRRDSSGWDVVPLGREDLQDGLPARGRVVERGARSDCCSTRSGVGHGGLPGNEGVGQSDLRTALGHSFRPRDSDQDLARRALRLCAKRISA